MWLQNFQIIIFHKSYGVNIYILDLDPLQSLNLTIQFVLPFMCPFSETISLFTMIETVHVLDFVDLISQTKIYIDRMAFWYDYRAHWSWKKIATLYQKLIFFSNTCVSKSYQIVSSQHDFWHVWWSRRGLWPKATKTSHKSQNVWVQYLVTWHERERGAKKNEIKSSTPPQSRCQSKLSNYSN